MVSGVGEIGPARCGQEPLDALDRQQSEVVLPATAEPAGEPILHPSAAMGVS
jgi:hypothetical protein